MDDDIQIHLNCKDLTGLCSLPNIGGSSEISSRFKVSSDHSNQFKGTHLEKRETEYHQIKYPQT